MTVPPEVDRYIHGLVRGALTVEGRFEPGSLDLTALCEAANTARSVQRVRIVHGEWKLFWRWPMWSRIDEFDARPRWFEQTETAPDGEEQTTVNGEFEIVGAITCTRAPWWMRALTAIRWWRP